MLDRLQTRPVQHRAFFDYAAVRMSKISDEIIAENVQQDILAILLKMEYNSRERKRMTTFIIFFFIFKQI